MGEPLLKIGEIAGFFNVSVKAIRVYEKKGLLKPAKIDGQTGYRYYTVSQVQRLNALLELKSLGFSLAEIRGLLDAGGETRIFQEALEKKKRDWREKIAAAENKLDALERITRRVAQPGAGEDLGRMTEEERAWYLVKMVCVEDLRAQSLLSEALWL